MSQISALQAHEDYFGPPSEPIQICEFLNACAGSNVALEPQELDEMAQIECSVDDLRSVINSTLSDPTTYASVVHSHERTISALGTTATKKSLKRKRYDTLLQDINSQSAPVARLRTEMESIRLKCWAYMNDSVAFVRPPKNSDSDALTEVRTSPTSTETSASGAESSSSNPQALIFISTYSRLTWGNHLSRNSQHVLQSSQTLGDLYEAVPCPSNEITYENTVNGSTSKSEHRGCVVCVEGVLYGDGQSEDDYAEKLLRHIDSMPDSRRPSVLKGTGIHDQVLASLALRTNQPYWLVHQGNCEHFFVVDHIRLMRSDDRKDGYPLTVFIAPPVLDLCQACSRVPATLSIVGDLRLGQSPCKLCQTCWSEFGEPSDEDVLVVPLCRYQIGW